MRTKAAEAIWSVYIEAADKLGVGPNGDQMVASVREAFIALGVDLHEAENRDAILGALTAAAHFANDGVLLETALGALAHTITEIEITERVRRERD